MSDVDRQNSETTVANLAAENARLRQDAERLARRLAGRYEETVGLRAQIEWMRPVVEAAEAWTEVEATRSDATIDSSIWLEAHKARTAGLLAAVDAYRAGQKGPSGRLSGPQSDEQGSGVAQDVHDGPEAHRAAEAVGICGNVSPALLPGQRRLNCDLPHGHLGWHSCAQIGSDRAHWGPNNEPTETDQPAGPPGLDAAIQAAAEAMGGHGLGRTDADRNHVCTCERWADCAGEESWDDHMADIAVRAAAPALRAGALRAAADEAAASDWAWLRIDAKHWLRERADRIGGAT